VPSIFSTGSPLIHLPPNVLVRSTQYLFTTHSGYIHTARCSRTHCRPLVGPSTNPRCKCIYSTSTCNRLPSLKHVRHPIHDDPATPSPASYHLRKTRHFILTHLCTFPLAYIPTHPNTDTRLHPGPDIMPPAKDASFRFYAFSCVASTRFHWHTSHASPHTDMPPSTSRVQHHVPPTADASLRVFTCLYAYVGHMHVLVR
jgi:hypothetical protein